MAPPPPSPSPHPPSLDELLYALSQITFRHQYRPPSPEPAAVETSTEKHLKLLNLLSLLLVTSKKGDVAAVTLRVHPNRIDLYYAKNRPCTDAEKRYISGLFSLATSADLSPDPSTAMSLRREKITFEVILNCRQKINSRIQRLRDHLKTLPAHDFSISASACEDAQTTAKFIRDEIGEHIFLRDEPLESFLQEWFMNLLATMPATKTPAAICELLMISYYVGNAPAIKNILDGGLLNRLRKVGDYFAAPIALTTAVASLKGPHLEKLSFVEVIPEPPRILPLPANFLTTINDWGRHSGNGPVMGKELSAAFPNGADLPRPNDPPVRSITTSVHCECTLILALLDSPLVPSKCEIGVSKSLCWVCREFIFIVERTYPNVRIHTSSCHGKIVAGWALPERASSILKRAITKRIHDEVDDILERVKKKRSDSLPHGGVGVRVTRGLCWSPLGTVVGDGLGSLGTS